MDAEKERNNRLARARWHLHNNHPFFCRISQNLQPVWTKEIPTAGVDSNGNLYFNPDFLDRCSDMDIVGVLCHEAMHVVTMTMGRAPKGVIFKIWNIASDAVINPICFDSKEDGKGCGLPVISSKALQGLVPIYGGEWAKYANGTTEQAYYDILKNPEKMLGMSLEDFLERYGDNEGDDHGSSGDPKQAKEAGGELKGRWWDDTASRLGKPSQAEGKNKENGQAMSNNGGMTEEQRTQWEQRIRSATARARAAGKYPGALEQFITPLLAPKKDWKRELRFIATSAIKSRITWKRIGRRTAGSIRTPGRDPGIPTAVVYIDTSGSMSDADLQRCLSEAAGIAQSAGGKVHLILGDCVIYFSGEKDSYNLGRLKEVQRGGTDFTVLFKHIEETFKVEPAILIGFTDLCGPFPEKPPSFPVVWCRPKNGYEGGKAPWGRTIEVEL